MVARRHPHLRCQSFDLPVVEPIARAHIARDGMSGRVEAVSGDFFKDRLPEADIITMGMILHDWNLGGKMKLIKRLTTRCLREGRLSPSRTSSITSDARTSSA